MIPYTDQSLRHLSTRLMTQILPDIGNEYSMSDTALVGLLINAIADEAEQGIQRRLEDINELREIFVMAAGSLTAAELELASSELKSYRLSDVNELHDGLTRILIELQTRDEKNPVAGPAAEPGSRIDVTNSIWRYLRRHADRHTIRAIP
ncbi:MAG: hypothetical protein ACI8Z1_003908 [Candidatus Azotimanducaceae bacterium]|jgi:hypothetical protein